MTSTGPGAAWRIGGVSRDTHPRPAVMRRTQLSLLVALVAAHGVAAPSSAAARQDTSGGAAAEAAAGDPLARLLEYLERRPFHERALHHLIAK